MPGFFLAAGVAGSSGSREAAGQGFWRCSDLLSEKMLATFVEGEGEEAKPRAEWRADWSPSFLLGSTK